jgi:hypothetical protein
VRLRCHLLIGPPASGKTTLAGVLAELTGAVVLSTDVVRHELFGDAAVQGPWRDIEALCSAPNTQACTGFFFALMSMTNKIGYALPVGVLYPILELIGFNPNGGNTGAPLMWLAAMFVGVPILCKLLIIALTWNFPITRAMQEALRTELSGQG